MKINKENKLINSLTIAQVNVWNINGFTEAEIERWLKVSNKVFDFNEVDAWLQLFPCFWFKNKKNIIINQFENLSNLELDKLFDEYFNEAEKDHTLYLYCFQCYKVLAGLKPVYLIKGDEESVCFCSEGCQKLWNK